MMTPTNFMIILLRFASSLPMALSSPPQADTQKPKMMAKMISGSILDLTHSSEKSETVSEWTSSSAAVGAVLTSLAVISMLVPAEGLNRLTQVSTQAAAIRPVKIKVPMVPASTLPRRLMLAMLPTAEAMETKTSGTTMVNSRLRKISPMGLMVVATVGATAPMTAPMRIPPRIRIRLPYCCQNVFCLMIVDDVDMMNSPLAI